MQLDLLSQNVVSIVQHELYMYHLTSLGLDITDAQTWIKKATLSLANITSFVVNEYGLYVSTDTGVYTITLSQIANGGELVEKLALFLSITDAVQLKVSASSLLVITSSSVLYFPILTNKTTFFSLSYAGITHGDISYSNNRLILFKNGLGAYYSQLPTANWTLASMTKVANITNMVYKKLSGNLFNSEPTLIAKVGTYGVAFSATVCYFFKFVNGRLTIIGSLTAGETLSDAEYSINNISIVNNTLSMYHASYNMQFSAYTIAANDSGITLKFGMQSTFHIYIGIVTEDTYFHLLNEDTGFSLVSYPIVNTTTLGASFRSVARSSTSYAPTCSSGINPVSKNIIVLGLLNAASAHTLNVFKYNPALHSFDRLPGLTAPNLCPAIARRMVWEGNYLYIICGISTVLLVVYELVGDNLILRAQLNKPFAGNMDPTRVYLSVFENIIVTTLYASSAVSYTFYFNPIDNTITLLSPSFQTDNPTAFFTTMSAGPGLMYACKYRHALEGLYEARVDNLAALTVNKLVANQTEQTYTAYLAANEGVVKLTFPKSVTVASNYKLIKSMFNNTAVKDIVLRKDATDNRGQLVYGTDTAGIGKFGIIDLGKV